MAEKGKIEIRTIPLIPYRDMREVKGTYDEITLKENYKNTNCKDYMHVILTDEEDILVGIISHVAELKEKNR